MLGLIFSKVKASMFVFSERASAFFNWPFASFFMKFILNHLAFAAFVCVSGHAFAQSEAPSASTPQQAQGADGQAEVTLPDTVVTATRTPTQVNDTPGASFVVSRQQMQARATSTRSMRRSTPFRAHSTRAARG